MSLIYRDYICTKEIREKLLEEDKVQIYKTNISRQKETEKYNPDDIFKKTESSIDLIAEKTTNTALIEYKESFFTRFKNFIFKILHIENNNMKNK